MSKLKTTKVVRRAVTRVKTAVTKAKARSDRSAKALTAKVRRAMPKAGSKSKAARGSAVRPRSRRSGKKDGTLLSALKEGLEFLGESVMPSSSRVRSRRR